MNEQELFEYYSNYWSIHEDKWTSFSYGRFLYDMLVQGRIDENSTLYECLECKVQCYLSQERRPRINGKIIGELLDLSELQNIASTFIFGEYNDGD